VFKYIGIVIRHTLNEWKQTLDRWAEGANNAIMPAGEMSTDDYNPFGYMADDALPQLFIKVPRAISKLGIEVSRQYAQMTEAFDRYKTQFGDKFQQGEPFSMLSTSDPLTEWTYDERVNVLERCHLEWERNPDANAAVTYNRLFSVGGGMQITYRNNEVKEAIEAFRNNPENAFGELEKTLIDTIQVQGELFMRFHGEGDAESIIMTPLPAWGIKRIKHERGFIRRVIHYEYQISEDDGTGVAEVINDNIPAAEVIHVAINRLSHELRGRPELYKVLVWLQAHKEWLEDRARQNHYRGSILYDVTLTNANGAQVAAKLAQYKKPPAGQAAIVVHNDKETWLKLDDAVNAAGAAEDGREMRLKVATGMRLPEYFLADGSNANLASATAQAVPAIYSFADWQDIARDRIFKPVFLKVLELTGVDLDKEVPVHDTETGEEIPGETVKIRDAFDIKYRSLDDSEPASVMQALSVATDKEWMSDETAAGLMPYDVDYKKELEKIAAKREREIDEIAQGKRMAPPQFGLDNTQPGDNNNGSNDGQSGGNEDGEDSGNSGGQVGSTEKQQAKRKENVP
jgi:hypothetical protein